jgi:hypothetical protein
VPSSGGTCCRTGSPAPAVVLVPKKTAGRLPPIALTVNFAAGVAESPFQTLAVPVRSNRSTQHGTVTLGQRDADGVLLASSHQIVCCQA